MVPNKIRNAHTRDDNEGQRLSMPAFGAAQHAIRSKIPDNGLFHCCRLLLLSDDDDDDVVVDNGEVVGAMVKKV